MISDSARPRRLRNLKWARDMFRETRVTAENLVYPLFVTPGKKIKKEISSMPGCFHVSADEAAVEAGKCRDLGINALLMFGLPSKKDPLGKEAYDPKGPVPEAVRLIKRSVPELAVITDVCLCEYTSHGHCGVVKKGPGGDFLVDNDSTVELLVKEALVHARAGADLVAPSDMMDNRVGAIRRALDGAGFQQTGILSYAAKYSSAFYGPFREAAESAPQFGDRKTYQMDPANFLEALREVELDIMQGADIVMVKPALAYLDVLRAVKEKFQFPTAAYNVSGEYSMVKLAAQKGLINEKAMVLEILTSIKRAGADMIITYHAKEAAKWSAE
ncbi:MAG: porphobilinogen synthase [Elusimicrobia bacterium CG08_land_8_20_14_0_20_59_10]|nr:MAG: porphobilinogen synthase [Elusimicrobia bacterium CG08_land_8_20_14_0_20_59_10]